MFGGPALDAGTHITPPESWSPCFWRVVALLLACSVLALPANSGKPGFTPRPRWRWPAGRCRGVVCLTRNTTRQPTRARGSHICRNRVCRVAPVRATTFYEWVPSLTWVPSRCWVPSKNRVPSVRMLATSYDAGRSGGGPVVWWQEHGGPWSAAAWKGIHKRAWPRVPEARRSPLTASLGPPAGSWFSRQEAGDLDAARAPERASTERTSLSPERTAKLTSSRRGPGLERR